MATMATRWATFDCYGTLIDWNAGIGGELERMFGGEAAPRLLERYHQLEPELESESYRSYREVLTLALEELLREEGLQLPEGEAGALARSLPGWRPFPEVPDALAELRRRGWKLAILSNTDRDLIAASQKQLGVPFDLVVVAEDVQSYKPAHAHWERFFEATTADREHHVHVAASLFHDIAPGQELGVRTVWINRLGETAEPAPDRELPDLAALPDTLDELVSA
jgi:2-haloacid dehalogenase